MSVLKNSYKLFTSLFNDTRGVVHQAILKPASFNRNIHITSNLEAIVSFHLSDIGEGIRDVVVKEWFVKVGDKVSQFDHICEVQSDKASVTITSRYDGVITKLHHQIEQIALVGTPLIDIEIEGDEEKSSSSSSSSDSSEDEISNEERPPPSSTTPQFQMPPPSDNTIQSPTMLCIPSVRRLAKEYNINLGEVTPTGKKGRILKEDVLKYLEAKATPQVVASDVKQIVPTLVDRVEALTPFQKGMVKTMTEALKIPHFVYSDEIAVTKLVSLRKFVKDEVEKTGVKLSLMPFFIKAVSNALLRYPILNATLDDNCEKVTYRAAHNVGIAMDTKIGLAVPVIKSVDHLSIIDIARELNRLMKTGKDGSFSPKDLSGGSFTISNIGIIGGTYCSPIILPPQVAILAIGVTKTLPRFDESKNIVAEDIISVSGAADHRIVDGASMANFVNQFKKQIEDPNLLFLNL